jgi:hypothetical protein
MTAKNRHITALAALAGRPNAEGAAVYNALRRLEKRACRANEAACNTPEGAEAQDGEHAAVLAGVRGILGYIPRGFFVNGDPRGYALKIDNEKVTVPAGITTDWGGYGCLAPTFKR